MPAADKQFMLKSDASQSTVREHFIPLRKSDLVRMLADEKSLSPDARAKFLDVCRLLSATFHFEYQERLEELKDSYAPFDPDADTLNQPLADQAEARLESFFEQLVWLHERANFCRLNRQQIEESIATASTSDMKLEVDFAAFARLEVFTRGEGVFQCSQRRMRNFHRRETTSVPTYRRLVVAFCFHNSAKPRNLGDADQIHLKFFKEIPHADLEMLLPGARLRMSSFDQFRIMLPTISGIAMMIAKIVKGALVLTFAGVYSTLAFLGLVGGTVGYGVKSFLGYLRTKDKYQLNLTKNLYYKNLDNNAGVLFRLLNEVEEQEFREAILAYFLLWQQAPKGGWTRQELDQRAEDFLRNMMVRVDVDFEVDDALAKLRRLELVTMLPDQRLQAVAIDEALIRLDRAWDGFFTYNTPTMATQADLKKSA